MQMCPCDRTYFETILNNGWLKRTLRCCYDEDGIAKTLNFVFQESRG